MKTLKNYFLISILVFSLVLLLGLGARSVFAEPEISLDGEGTQENPYLISSEEDLIYFRDLINGGTGNSLYYRLEASFNLGQEFSPIGTDENPFSGTFDGNGKQISGVSLSNGQNVGFFGVLNGATVKDLGLEVEIVIEGSEQTTIGSVAAKATASTISGCSANVSLSASQIVRQEEQYASTFSTIISGSERTALSSVTSVEVFNLEEFQPQDVFEIENNYLFFKTAGFWNFSVVRNQRTENYVASVALENGNLETTFFSQTNAPSSVREEDLEILNSTEQVITVENGNLVFNREGIFLFNINSGSDSSRYCAVVTEQDGAFNAQVFAETIASVRETFQFETYSYAGQITFGGIVGEALDSFINNSYAVPSISILQGETESSISSNFGGIAGHVVNGEIINVYVAPTTSLVSEIVSKNGNLAAITFEAAPIKINNSSSTNSVTFGGIVGLARGSGLKINNTMFFSFLASLSPNNVGRGGIVGAVSQNSSLWPEVMYGKYLSLSNLSTSMMNFSSGVGNAASVGFSVNSSVGAVSAMPTSQSFDSWAWNEFRMWDFENVWKDTSIIPQLGYFFPSLQKFAVVTISVVGQNEVSFTPGGNYLRGYYTLEIDGQSGTSIDITTGATITLTATFYSEDGNKFRDFNKFFTFTNWMQNSYSVSEISYDSPSVSQDGYTVTVDEETGQTKISFVASSRTEGNYDVRIEGKPVEVNVYLFNNETETSQNNIGVITKTAANREERFTSNFTFTIEEYLNGEVVSLVADDSESGNFVFANRWVDGNLTTQTTSLRSITIELNNEQTSTSARFYPRVIPTENGLVANIIAYFSEYTVSLTIEVGSGGTISLNGETYSENFSQNVIIGQTITLTANPNKGMELVGWYINGVLQESTNLSIDINPSIATTVSAAFREIPDDGGGLEAWAIALIVIAGVVVIVGVVLTIVLVRRRSYKSYKKKFKNFRY